MQIQISDHFNYKKLFRFTLPSMLMMVVTSVYGVIDGYFISNFVGKTAFAAINLVIPYSMILGGAGFMIGAGGVAIVSKAEGENDPERAKRYFTMLIIFASLLGVVLTIVGVLTIRPVAVLFGATDDMIEYCVLYGRVLIAFTVFFMLQCIFQSFLAAAGKPKLGLVVTLIAGCSNAALDALFIAVLNGGVLGAALATGAGQVLGGVIPLVYFAKNNGSLLRFVKTKIELKPVLKACVNGSSELLTNVATSVVSIIYNLQLMKFYGEDGVSAYGVLMYVELVFFAIEIGYSIGSAPIIAYNYGAKNYSEQKSLFKKSMIILSVSGVLLCVAAQLLAYPLARLFVGYDDALCSLTVKAFRIFSFSFIFSGITIFSSGFFTALNNGLVSAALSVLRSLVFRILFVFLLPYLSGADAIWLAIFAAEGSAFVVSAVMFAVFRKRYRYA